MPPITSVERYLDDDDYDWNRSNDRRHRASRPKPRRRAAESRRAPNARTPRSPADQAFKCGRCRSFIGAPLTGGRHRNHCPMCLYSRHVDGKRPGDRRGNCGSLMAPVGIVQRRNGEQLILHRCLGCRSERPNRVAADDNPVLLLRLPPVPPIFSAAPAVREKDEAIA